MFVPPGFYKAQDREAARAVFDSLGYGNEQREQAEIFLALGMAAERVRITAVLRRHGVSAGRHFAQALESGKL